VFEPHAVVLAEEPRKIADLWKQRLRWARGNVYVTWRFRKVWFRPSRKHRLGSLSFGLFWFSIFLLPAAMVLSTIGLLGLYFLHSPFAADVFRVTWALAACTYVFSIALAVQLDGKTGLRSWREAILFPGLVSIVVMFTAFFPDLLEVRIPEALGYTPNAVGIEIWTLFVYAWITLAMLGAWLAKSVEKTRIGGFLSPLLIYLVGYGPLLCAVTIDSYIKEARHEEPKWDKTEKIGRVVG
jgi:cellulose synthase/poly-beta-1,6-N-acetylglucosamine synthase-like glycosyltransferase